MARLTVACFRWGKKYTSDYVERLRAGVERHLKQDYRFAVFAPEEADEDLKKGCFCRLRMWDKAWQEKRGFEPGDRIVSIDLDAIVAGPLDSLFETKDEFSILAGANASNPCPFNGSIFMLTAGTRHDVWDEFSLEAAAKVPFFQFPDDQAWLAARYPDAKGWKVGKESGIYAFQKPGWPKGFELPSDAKLVVFPGWRDPTHFKHLDWVKENWLGDYNQGTM